MVSAPPAATTSAPRRTGAPSAARRRTGWSGKWRVGAGRGEAAFQPRHAGRGDFPAGFWPLLTARRAVLTSRRAVNTSRRAVNTFRRGANTFRRGANTFRRAVNTFRRGVLTFRRVV